MADFQKVEANLPGYLRSSHDTDLKQTRKIAESLKAEELAGYKVLLEDASRRAQIDRDLYEFVLTLIDNWEGSSFHQRITVGLLLKKVQGDTRLWDLLSHDNASATSKVVILSDRSQLISTFEVQLFIDPLL